MARPCIVDCDPGHDDAVALLLAAASPELDLRAITTVAGNGELDKVTRNALRICTLAGIRDVPVAAGAERPLVRALETAADVHGESALDGPTCRSPTSRSTRARRIELIADVAAASPDPVTLIAIGPLTNVATALDAPPGARRIAARDHRHGRLDRAGQPHARTPSSTSRSTRRPPNSAREPACRSRWSGSTSPTRRSRRRPVVDRLRRSTATSARAVAGWIDVLRLDPTSTSGASTRRPCTTPAPSRSSIDPTLIRCVEAFVAIETKGDWTRGATVVDLHDRLRREPNATRRARARRRALLGPRGRRRRPAGPARGGRALVAPALSVVPPPAAVPRAACAGAASRPCRPAGRAASGTSA